MTTYIYIKTHNKTGVKYLGITTEDPHTYPGSGIDWKQLLLEQGEDHTTEVIHECQSKAEVREWGLYYSDLWDIVNSPEWMNRKREQGMGGSDPGQNRGKQYNKSAPRPGGLGRGCWWNNGVINRNTHECPGPEWQRGQVPGLKFWNNGIINTRSRHSPGPEWQLGRIAGRRGWTNGTQRRMSAQSPGPEWWEYRQADYTKVKDRGREAVPPNQYWRDQAEKKDRDLAAGLSWLLGLD